MCSFRRAWIDIVRRVCPAILGEEDGYIEGWEGRGKEGRELVEKGVVPMERDMEEDRDVDLP